MSSPVEATALIQQKRIWALCYRMTGEAAAADDLTQEALTRGLERADQLADRSAAEGWLIRIATTTCLDWLRRRAVERRFFAVVDPVELEGAPFTEDLGAEGRLLRRDDLRLAVLTTLQALSPRQRAVLVLRDVCDMSTEETATILEMSAGGVKMALHRARIELRERHRAGATDVLADPAVVEAFASALERGDLTALEAVLKDDVWGLIDDGARRRRPTLGARAVARQFFQAGQRLGAPPEVERRFMNGEPMLLVLGYGVPFALLHAATSTGRIASIRVLRDPHRLARLVERDLRAS